MISPILVVQLALMLSSLVEGYQVLHHPVVFHPQMYHAFGGEGYKQIAHRNNDGTLPCPGEAFYVHPDNCTRFYRCVDYTGTGSLFSRYLFECPKGHVFITAVQTCLPGYCPNAPQPVVVPPTTPQAPKPTTPGPKPSVIVSTESPVFPQEIETDSPFPVKPSTESLFPIKPMPVTTTPAPPIPAFPSTTSTQRPVVITVAPSPTVTPAPPANEEPCPDRYVQHPDFCNVYTPCNEPSVRYVCPGGTAFDQSRQMCRISASDDGLCLGKRVFEHPFLLRSENLGTHVRLPDYIYVPTSRPFHTSSMTGVQVVPAGYPYVPKPGFPTASPLQLYLWPTPKPSVIRFNPPLPNFGIEKNVHRPLFNRPAQVYRRPDEDESPSADTYDTTFQIFRPVGIESAPPAATKLRPLAQVRRPDGHLHLPYVPAHVFGFQREVV